MILWMRPSLPTLLILLLIMPSANGIMGYDISARANDSSLEIHRSIQEIKFDSSGLINGFGNFSRYGNIEGFAGIRTHELSSSSWPGRIGYADKIALRTGEGPVLITARLQSDVIYSGDNTDWNRSEKLAASEYVNVDIDENWRAYLANQKKILYSGPGIRVNEIYENNGDYVKSSIDSWELSRDSLYRTALNRTIISANLTPQGVFLDEFSNKSSIFLLNQGSVGRKTHIDLGQIGHSHDAESRIIEDYIGQQNITMALNMGDWIMKPEYEDAWLDCCFGLKFKI